MKQTIDSSRAGPTSTFSFKTPSSSETEKKNDKNSGTVQSLSEKKQQQTNKKKSNQHGRQEGRREDTIPRS